MQLRGYQEADIKLIKDYWTQKTDSNLAHVLSTGRDSTRTYNTHNKDSYVCPECDSLDIYYEDNSTMAECRDCNYFDEKHYFKAEEL